MTETEFLAELASAKDEADSARTIVEKITAEEAGLLVKITALEAAAAGQTNISQAMIDAVAGIRASHAAIAVALSAADAQVADIAAATPPTP